MTLYVRTGLSDANNLYSEKHESGSYSQKVMISLAWKIRELSGLNDEGRKLKVQISTVLERLADPRHDLVNENIANHLTTIRNGLNTFIKGVTHQKRTAATPILVFMVSPEERSRKPYALPVQLIPYTSLSDAKVRELANNIIQEMKK